MNKRLWFARAVAVYGVGIFSFLSYLYLAEPLQHIERFGIAASGVPESVAFLRVGPGAMFLFLAVTALYGLLRQQMLRTSLIILVAFNACVVAARLFGVFNEGLSPIQMTELRDEGTSWLLFVAALLALRGQPVRHRGGSGGWN